MGKQFSTASLMLAIAFLAGSFGGMVSAGRTVHLETIKLPALPLMGAPFWVPLVFAGYWAGKKAITAPGLLLFLAAECAAVVLANLGLELLIAS